MKFRCKELIHSRRSYVMRIDEIVHDKLDVNERKVTLLLYVL